SLVTSPNGRPPHPCTRDTSACSSTWPSWVKNCRSCFSSPVLYCFSPCFQHEFNLHPTVMKCPVCKYDNTQGATHCGMCYEAFNRSAADAYLRQARRERIQHEQQNGASSAETPPAETLQQSVTRIKAALPTVDWQGGIRQAKDAVYPYRKKLVIGL